MRRHQAGHEALDKRCDLAQHESADLIQLFVILIFGAPDPPVAAPPSAPAAGWPALFQPFQ